MITVREYKFGAMVSLDPSACADAVRRLVGGTRPQCVLQPCDGKWFPAAVSVREPSQGRPVDAVLRVRLLTGEPQAFFATGQAFTLWADAIVDDQTVRGEGFVCDGVIVNHEPAAGEDTRTGSPPGHTHRRTVPRPRLGTGGSGHHSGLLTFAAIYTVGRAFANGGSSLTRIEAVSNAVSALRPPEGRSARHLLVTQGCIVAFLIAGISWLACVTRAVPYRNGFPTVLSQEATLIFGPSAFGRALFFLAQAGAISILFTGGNTSSAGFRS